MMIRPWIAAGIGVVAVAVCRGEGVTLPPDIGALKGRVEAACPARWHALTAPIRPALEPRDVWRGNGADRARFVGYLRATLTDVAVPEQRLQRLADDRLTVAAECAAQHLRLLEALRRKVPRDLIKALSETSVLLADGASDGDTLLAETFTGDKLDGWRTVDEGSRHGPSAWRIVDGGLRQQSTIASTGGGLSSLGTWALYEPGRSWTDYRAAFLMQSVEQGGRLGVMIRFRDERNYYRFDWSGVDGSRRLLKSVDGRFVSLAEDEAAFVTGREYDVEVAVRGPLITVRVDDGIIFGGPVEDDAIDSGSVAFYTHANGGAMFDDLIVTAD